MKGYKLFRKMKDGYAPLFIDARNRLQLGDEQECKYDLMKVGFAVRHGWHGCYKPYAPHLSIAPKNSAKRVWLEVEVSGWVEKYERPEKQGGAWFTCQNIKLIRELNKEEVQELLNE